jgi:hypothetical protein
LRKSHECAKYYSIMRWGKYVVIGVFLLSAFTAVLLVIYKTQDAVPAPPDQSTTASPAPISGSPSPSAPSAVPAAAPPPPQRSIADILESLTFPIHPNANAPSSKSEN